MQYSVPFVYYFCNICFFLVFRPDFCYYLAMRYPLDGPIRITQTWGQTNAALTGGVHRGVDYACASGTPVLAITGGRVVQTGYSATGGYYVIISSPGLLHRYYHLSRILTTRDKVVSEGQVIAHSGASGLSTGPHLHLETELNGVNVDPETVINNSGIIHPAPAPQPPTSDSHIIVAGDTFWGLEEQYGLPHGTLQALNPGIDPRQLRIGMTINVRAPATPVPPIARRQYTIKAGDTLWDLHNAWQLPQGTLQQLNPGIDPYNLQIGQVIYIS